MSDRGIRELERQAAAGDQRAGRALLPALARTGRVVIQEWSWGRRALMVRDVPARQLQLLLGALGGRWTREEEPGGVVIWRMPRAI